MLPSREDTAAELARLRDLGAAATDSEVAQFVAAECRIANHALVEASVALAAQKRLGALQYLRLLTEVGIRMWWLCGEDQAADELGRFVADPVVVVSRVRRLRRRDLELLAAAREKINPGADPSLSAQLRAMAAELGEPTAPRFIADLATTVPAKSLYAGHLMASAQIHPGAPLSQGIDAQQVPIGEMLQEASYMCAAVADAALRSQGVDTGPPFPAQGNAATLDPL